MRNSLAFLESQQIIEIGFPRTKGMRWMVGKSILRRFVGESDGGRNTRKGLAYFVSNMDMTIPSSGWE